MGGGGWRVQSVLVLCGVLLQLTVWCLGPLRQAAWVRGFASSVHSSGQSKPVVNRLIDLFKDDTQLVDLFAQKFRLGGASGGLLIECVLVGCRELGGDFVAREDLFQSPAQANDQQYGHRG